MTDLEQLYDLAKNSIEMQKAGLLRTMTEAEKEKMKQDFPGAVMVLGEFVVMKWKD